MCSAVRLIHGFASKLRPRKTRCLPARIEISHSWVTQFLADLSGPSSTQTRELREQLDRASLSALLNLPKAMRGERDASGQNSLMMRAAQLSNAQLAWMLLWPKDFLYLLERIQPGKEMLVRIVAMLTKLVERFDPYQYRVRESAPSVTEPFENEDDHEDD